MKKKPPKGLLYLVSAATLAGLFRWNLPRKVISEEELNALQEKFVARTDRLDTLSCCYPLTAGHCRTLDHIHTSNDVQHGSTLWRLERIVHLGVLVDTLRPQTKLWSDKLRHKGQDTLLCTAADTFVLQHRQLAIYQQTPLRGVDNEGYHLNGTTLLDEQQALVEPNFRSVMWHLQHLLSPLKKQKGTLPLSNHHDLTMFYTTMF